MEDQMLLMAFGMLGGLMIINFVYEVLQTRRMYQMEEMIGDAVLKMNKNIEKIYNQIIDENFK